MAKIRDLNTLIGYVDRGRPIAEINDAFRATLEELLAMSEDQPKRKLKGSIDLKLSITVENGLANIELDYAIKKPKKPRGSSILWVEKGALSDEMPKQINLFDRETAQVIDGSVNTPRSESNAATG